MNDCLFCNIIAGKVPATKVYENDQVYAFRDINPQAPVHVLVIPKAHLPSMDGVTERTLPNACACLLAIPEIAKQEGVAGGYRVVSNCGPDAGQTVPHLHFHLLGGTALGARMA